MRDLNDVLMQAQGGQAMANMAQMFGVSEEQVKAAVQATLPAFSAGLQQNTEDADYLGQFMDAVGSGRHAPFFDDPSTLTNPEIQQEGDGILGHLFGSREVSRMVADQAAQASGLGASVIRQMLPLIASMIMGSLFRQSQGSGIQDMITEIIRNMTGGAPSTQTQTQAPAPTPAPQQPAGNDNPFGDILRDILGGAFGGSAGGGAGSGSTGGGMPQMPQLPQTGADFFGNLFQPGMDAAQQIQESQLQMTQEMIRANKKRRGGGRKADR